MNDTLVDKVAEAVLYEGYIFYPYRATAARNRERFTFGRVYPADYNAAQDGAEPCVMQTQCLARRVTPGACFDGRVRFLHSMAREVCIGTGTEDITVVQELRVDGQLYQTWHEATEREVIIPQTPLAEGRQLTLDFVFPASESIETLRDAEGREAGAIRRRQRTLEGVVHVMVEAVDEEVMKITVGITNRTPMPDAENAVTDAILLATFASTHTILSAEDAEFLSQTDPPAHYALAAIECDNIGTWPVLVGDEEMKQRDTLLSSPIILYDYPKIAAESDGTETEQILTLRAMTMGRDETPNADPLARRNPGRPGSPGHDGLMKTHGTMRDVRFAGFAGTDYFDHETPLNYVMVQGVPLATGDRVRIRPRNRADAMDVMLAGKIAVIDAIELDAEGLVHFALLLEDDPGCDLGMLQQPGHRFTYTIEEVEPLTEEE
jgi:hypothetical protein